MNRIRNQTLTARTQLRAVLVSGVVLLLTTPFTADVGESVSLRSVYNLSFTVPEVGAKPHARFDGTGQMVYLVEPQESRVRLIDWRRSKELSVRRYAEIPCPNPGPATPATIQQWEPLDNGIILMKYCGSLYFLDSRTLVVKNKLENEKGEYFGVVAFSPNRQIMAVGVATEAGDRIRIHEVNTLTPVTEWSVKDFARGLAFTVDGKYLVGTVDEVEPPAPGQKVLKQKSCRLVSWSADTWELSSETTFVEGGKRRTLDCPTILYRIPGRDVFIDMPLRIRDLRNGTVLKTIRSQGVLTGFVSNEAVSNNGRWLATTVKTNFPPDSGRAFRIFDLETGEVVYDRVLLRASTVPRAFSWSPDDRYLLVTTRGEIAIYEVQQ
jgi:WD40 repeat protein